MKRGIITGVFASLSLVAFFFAVMLLFTGSPSVAISQIRNLWSWFTLLVVGFGTQFGLFTHLKSLAKSSSSDGGPKGHSSEVERGMISANTGLSSVSMVACCAHHLTDVLPFFGLAGLSLFLTRYQVWFLGIGILSNFAGIIYLLRQINKHQAYVQN